jgi:hypothetical protein
MLTVEETAQAIGLAKSTLWDVLRRGDFPVKPIRLGRRVYIPLAPLVRVLEGEELESPPEIALAPGASTEGQKPKGMSGANVQSLHAS